MEETNIINPFQRDFNEWEKTGCERAEEIVNSSPDKKTEYIKE